MHEGTIDHAAVYPREIITEALKVGAARIICAHNHPSGGVEPSAADHRITRELIAAAYPLGIDVLEHIIIGGSDYFSFAESGRLKIYQDEFKKKYGH